MRSGQEGSFKLVDGRLELTIGGAVFVYSNLYQGATGEQRWLVEKYVDGRLLWIDEAAMLKVQEGATFTSTGLVNNWRTLGGGGSIFDRLWFRLFANGSSERAILDPTGLFTYGAAQWSLASDGRMTLIRPLCSSREPDCGLTQTRTWELVGTVGNRIYVMEDLEVTDSYSLRRLNFYQGEPLPEL